MPKRKAKWWPSSILADPDVLSVDDEGRFVLCKICHVHYAVHGGKKPKPVIMNSNFRTRAWDVHKERTNSHRLQKQQERLQQTKAQQQEQQAGDVQEQQRLQATQEQQPQMQPADQGQHTQGPQPPVEPPQVQTRAQGRPIAAMPSQPLILTQAPPHQVQGQDQAPDHLTQLPQVRQIAAQTSLRAHSGVQVLQQRRQQQQQQQLDQQEQQHVPEPDEKGTTGDHQQVAARNGVVERPASAGNAQAITVATMSKPSSVHGSGMTNGAGKRAAQTTPVGTPMQRRRVFRAGSPGSSMQLLAESEAARRPNAHTYERHSFMMASAANHAKRTGPSDHDLAMEQADSSARWRHMHDDVSRALNAAPRRRHHQGPSSYTSGELRAAKALAQTETGDLGSNNSERVAKKLRSLNAEYHASNMRHADGYNMRHTDVFDRRSAGYKEYWGTLRDVYTSLGTSGVPASAVTIAHYRKSHNRGKPSAKPIDEETKETEIDSTTPDDSGSSEDASKPTVVVHDASLISAIDRLTDATSKQIGNLFQKEASGTREALVGLTSVMSELRVQHGNAFDRMIELQEKHLKVMEGILEIKLRKEAARNAKNSGNTDGSNSGCNGSDAGGSS